MPWHLCFFSILKKHLKVWLHCIQDKLGYNNTWAVWMYMFVFLRKHLCVITFFKACFVLERPYVKEWQWPWIFSDSHLRDKGPPLMSRQSVMCLWGRYIYIYAFSRRFYPKWLTVHSGYTYFISMCVPWELNPQPFALLRQCSTTEPQEHSILEWTHYFLLKVRKNVRRLE